MRKLSRIAVVGTVTMLAMAGCTTPPQEQAWTYAYQQFEVSTLEEKGEAMVHCLAEAGFTGYTVLWDGGLLSPSIPEAQRDTEWAAHLKCIDENIEPVGPVSDSEVEALYRLELAAVECLTDLGYTFSDPPSLQRYRDVHMTREQWSAYGSISSQIPSSNEAFEQLGSACPDPQWFSGSLPSSNE